MVLVKPEEYSGENPDAAAFCYKDKTPKQILQFSDGVLEEYSTDEEDSSASPSQQSHILMDTATMGWGPWMLYKTWVAGNSTLSFLDYIGEALASFFGITTPRYYFELEEYKQRKADEEKVAEERKGWSQSTDQVIEVPLKNVDNNPCEKKIEDV
ncbi:protein FAM177A1 [Euwallacea fornicatus]|uniref:protein FAM177A1 n=1 Tax=Euwallacea fornicatus TaxID=995702 RepID=UPI00338FCEA3